MSVEYSTRLGYGYRVSEAMVESLNDEDHDDFMDSRWTYPLNTWAAHTDYFFGIPQGFVEPGYMIEVPTRRNYAHEDFDKMTTEFKKYFPNEKNYICKDYIISQVY